MHAPEETYIGISTAGDALFMTGPHGSKTIYSVTSAFDAWMDEIQQTSAVTHPDMRDARRPIGFTSLLLSNRYTRAYEENSCVVHYFIRAYLEVDRLSIVAVYATYVRMTNETAQSILSMLCPSLVSSRAKKEIKA